MNWQRYKKGLVVAFMVVSGLMWGVIVYHSGKPMFLYQPIDEYRSTNFTMLFVIALAGGSLGGVTFVFSLLQLNLLKTSNMEDILNRYHSVIIVCLAGTVFSMPWLALSTTSSILPWYMPTEVRYAAGKVIFLFILTIIWAVFLLFWQRQLSIKGGL